MIKGTWKRNHRLLIVDRFHDPVMKVGIASGVVYPRAIAELADKYRFENFGGTSAGASAAVLCEVRKFTAEAANLVLAARE